MLAISKQLIEKLNCENIRYIHFKSNEHLDEATDGKTDFDILVLKEDANDFEQILLTLGFKHFNSPERSRYPGVDDWIGFDNVSGGLVHLHTHYQLITGLAGYKHIVLPWSTIALETYINDEITNMKIANPAFELVELYTRIVVKMNRKKKKRCLRHGLSLSGDDKKEAEWLHERVNEDSVKEMIMECFGKNVEIRASLFFETDISATDFLAFTKIVTNKLQIHRRACGNFLNLKSYVHRQKNRVFRKLKKYFFLPNYIQKKNPHTGGLFIAFLGVDGSGKTTISTEITEWLSWKFETSHMGLGYGRYKNTIRHKIKIKIKKLIKRNTQSKITPTPAGNSIISDTPMKRTAKNRKKQVKLVKFAKRINKDIRRIHSYCLSGGIMVVDRYPQLQYRGLADGPKVNVAYPKLQKQEYEYLKIIEEIQPDIIFRLFVPVELSKERRPEDPIEILEKKNEILHKVNYKGAKIIDVDATQSIGDELLFIKRQIWSML